MKSLPRHVSLPALAVLVVCAIAPTTFAQVAPVAASAPGPHRISAAASTDCADGLVYDDGVLDEAIRFSNPDTGIGLAVEAVMRFDIGATDAVLEQMCVCWNRDGIDDVDFSHELVFFAADGPSGQPGTQITSVPFTISVVPDFPSTTFIEYDLTPHDIRTTTPNIYAGVRWTSGDQGDGSFVLCTDQDGPGEQPMYARQAGTTEWLATDDIFAPSEIAPPTALMIRLEGQKEEPPATCPQEQCVEDEFTNCLNDERFKVTADFRTGPPQNLSGQAHKEGLTPDTGYFWFFRKENVEMVVKVLNGCANNGHYWVFAGGLTNVEVEMQVCDTRDGVLRSYTNPLKTPFQPIQDTGAFATCP